MCMALATDSRVSSSSSWSSITGSNHGYVRITVLRK
jgi:hypothetical protein